MRCKWCGKEIEGCYLIYGHYYFCREKNDQCLKDYLFDEKDKEIKMDYKESDEEWAFHEKCKKAEY